MFKRFATLAAIFTLMTISASSVLAQNKTYKCLMPGTYNISGKSKSQMEMFTEEVIKVLSDIGGVKIELVMSDLVEEAYMVQSMQMLMQNKADIVGFSGDWYTKLSDSNRKKFPILFGIIFDQKKNMNYCMYVRKSDNIKKIEQLKGKKYEGYIFKDARYVMHLSGIDEPLEKFFGSVHYKMPPYPIYMNDLVDKRVDAFVSWDFNIKTAMGLDPKYKDIVPIGCQAYTLNPFVIYRGDMDRAMIDKVQKAAFNWKKDKRFEKFKMFFMAINGGVGNFTEEDLKHTFEIEALSKKYGWDEERKALIKKLAD